MQINTDTRRKIYTSLHYQNYTTKSQIATACACNINLCLNVVSQISPRPTIEKTIFVASVGHRLETTNLRLLRKAVADSKSAMHLARNTAALCFRYWQVLLEPGNLKPDISIAFKY